MKERLRRVRRRLALLVGAHRFRRTRTLYWRGRYKLTTDPEKAGYYLTKARESARLGQQIGHTERILRKREKFLEREIDKATPPNGVVTFDGKPCAAWIAEWLRKSRQAGWKGVLVSGWRDPAYSESLCYAMCNAPSCPGKCAGRASNHSGSSYPAGACDVSDYVRFGEIQKKIGSPLRNALGPADPVHYSVSGK